MICPVCQTTLHRTEVCYVCEEGHSFDISKEGYVNLLLPNQKKTKDPGDNKEMIDARQRFLKGGYYEKLALRVAELAAGQVILDAGCGEGYYTSFLLKNSDRQVYGIDISKSAVRKTKGLKATFMVGSIYRLPFENESLDTIVNIFAPYSSEEFYRVLKDDGIWIAVCAGKQHLKELRHLIYGNNKGHEQKEFDEAGFKIVQQEKLSYKIQLDSNSLDDLLKMTPYYYQASLQKRQNIEALNKLNLTVDFDIFVLQKRRKNMINIAIDGFGGSGKSTLAEGLADKLGFKVLNTGAIYRGLACAYKDAGLKKFDEKTVAEFIKTLKVSVVFEGKEQHVIVNGKDYTKFLRLEEISYIASQISPIPALRKVVRAIQREFARENNCIIEGRDIGSEVLPNADVKLFVTASPEVRAQRRYAQLKDPSISFQTVLDDLNKRDYADVHRKVSPLVPAKDAVILDTSNMTLDESLNHCLNLIKSRISERS